MRGYVSTTSAYSSRMCANPILTGRIVEYRTSRHNSLSTHTERTPLLAGSRALSPTRDRDSDGESLVNGQPGGPSGVLLPQSVVVHPASPGQSFVALQYGGVASGGATGAGAGGAGVGVGSPLKAEHVQEVPEEHEQEHEHNNEQSGNRQ